MKVSYCSCVLAACVLALSNLAPQVQIQGQETSNLSVVKGDPLSSDITAASEFPPISGKPGGRAKLPKDLIAIRSYGTTSVSPDRKLIAIEVEGRVPGATLDSGIELKADYRTELWIVNRENGTRQCLTASKPVTLSHWNPVWSPDSQHLAFLSTEGQSNAFLELWDRSTGRVKRLTTLGVDLLARISCNSGDDDKFFWIDNTHLATILLPNGSRSPILDYFSRSTFLAEAGVQSAANGEEPTGVVATSPPSPSHMASQSSVRFVIIDTRTNAIREIGEIPAWIGGFAEHFVVISPDAQWAAIEAAVPPTVYIPDMPAGGQALMSRRLGIASLKGGTSGIQWVEGIQPASRVHHSYLRWEEKSAKFAVLGQDVSSVECKYVGEVEALTGKWSRVARVNEHQLLKNGLSVDITQVAWIRNGQIAVKAIASDPPEDFNRDLREAWWAVGGDSATPLSKADEAELEIQLPADDPIKLHTSETGRLYETNDAGVERTLFPDLNSQLTEIEEPRTLSFSYKATGGKQQFANVLLPHDFKLGTRYPTVVWVYGGDIHSEKDEPAHRNDDNATDELMMLSGQGYLVLIPSMPLQPQRIPGDPMLHLNDGVDPAIDKAISLGIVDPNRLAVMGHSFGGYSVFGLLTQTHRYRAGISLMGLSDLVSSFAAFTPLFRYDAPELAAAASPVWVESSQGGMAGPPWLDPDRYVRNSPIFHADKIATPILIIDGDLDFLGNQSEEMFTALSRQGRRAEYVRYLGEQHGPGSPANILDMWQRIFAWLDTYVKNPQEPAH
jgi:acetyl esterase/lipase